MASQQTYDASKSVNHPEQLAAFVKAPLTGNLHEIPGIGNMGTERLHHAGIESTFQLIGKFLSFENETNKANRAHAPTAFYAWLTEINAPAAYRAAIVEAIARRLEVAFEGLTFDVAGVTAGHKTHMMAAQSPGGLASQSFVSSQHAGSQGGEAEKH